MKTMEIVLNEERNVTLTMYLNLESKEFHHTARPLMVVLPGGGYSMCSDREAEVVALQYMAAGYQAAVLRYTLKSKGSWPHPINDYDEAMDYIAAHAQEWHIDMEHTATVGFSAGGHLAACTATLARHKPRGAVCVYPAILSDVLDACQPGMPRPNEHVDYDTSPCYIVSIRDDTLVSCKHALMFALALEEKGIQFENHIYSYGDHGFSVATPMIQAGAISDRVKGWVSGSLGWLEEIMGTFTTTGFTKPVLGRTVNGNPLPYLSIRCTFGHLLKQSPEALAVLEPVMSAIRAKATERGISEHVFTAFAIRYSLQALLEILQIPKEQLEQLDEKLNLIPNIR